MQSVRTDAARDAGSDSRSWKERVERARLRGAELADATYPVRADTPLECDLVMKGGITSGVVYPLAACELAKRYRFRNIGGSSAGAIAAVVVAAAEHGRDDGGFARLAGLPQTIGPTLPALFTPGPATRSAHTILMAGLDPDKIGWRKKLGVVGALVRSKWQWFVAGVVVGLAVAAVVALVAAGFWRNAGDVGQFVGAVAVALPVSIVAGLVAVAASQAISTWRGMNKQGFGICLGSAGTDAKPPTATNPGPLTDWLTVKIDELAGRDAGRGPLTFGDLASNGINLQVMTTDLTHGRPMSFPFSSSQFFYDPKELAAWFPPSVMKQLNDHAQPAVDKDGKPVTLDQRPLLVFPDAEHIPVVVAARVSLSFPGLISAVPLWALDASEPEHPKPIRCWLSDGGITSNFPVHFFDALWPSRPTFAINLSAYPPLRPDEDVYYPDPHHDGRAPVPNDITGTVGFFRAILDTMQYWSDDAQMMLPGYRDRIVDVHLSGTEGGMNLRMPADVIAVVAEKGRQAAEALSHFDFDEHRWTRFLVAMQQLQAAVARMEELYDDSRRDGASYAELLRREPGADYSISHDQQWIAAACARVDKLLSFVGTTDPDFADDAPEPAPTLRITPRF